MRIGVNPSNGDVVGSVPFDLTACPPEAVGMGTCLPPALSSTATSGICNLTALRVELVGMGSIDNPLGTDLTLPSGVGRGAAHAHGARPDRRALVQRRDGRVRGRLRRARRAW